MTARADDVRAMFTRIARRYDVMNALMTGGRHRAWRRAAARASVGGPAGPVLDLATGTADLALEIRSLARDRHVVGADFSEGMLAQARRKLAARGARRLDLMAADASRLPFRDGVFAAVTSAFLLRNLDDLDAGLREMRRVTMPGGLVVTLDITRLTTPGWSQLFALYFHRVVPLVGALVARDRAAYTYLPKSVDRFVTPIELAALMEKTGLRDVRYRCFGLGTVALHTGVV
jgi:demethylmenaquinone methyltransferase / 2-methoxy-6-polyprenyl-1,4-benzoquinol methylase